jgi:CDP-glucose 4,6-dehydratase
MENMEMSLFGQIYRDKKVLVTGHSGFKGRWLSVWLEALGAEVHGVSLNPLDEKEKNSFSLNMAKEYVLDIRDADGLANLLVEVSPEIIFHLAAQSLVLPSLETPLDTLNTNILGTANLLNACRFVKSVKAVLVVTSDKVYRNNEWDWAYRETDKLGGLDPYSASKSATELIVDSFRHSFFQTELAPLIASARAGNVIGGGDWSPFRLLPDVARAVIYNEDLVVRNPQSVRPWQHVLDSLSGYLMLGKTLFEGNPVSSGAWNFGPANTENFSVQDLLLEIIKTWPDLTWKERVQIEKVESKLLTVDSSKAAQRLGWQTTWDTATSIANTIDWYQSYRVTGTGLTKDQLNEYCEFAKSKNACWTRL